VSGGFELLTDIGGTPVLPYDGSPEWFTGRSVPENARFSLIGDTNGSDIRITSPRFLQNLEQCRALSRPDLIGIMFDPARGWKKLFELSLGYGDSATFVIE
jgi:hypothetical protein